MPKQEYDNTNSGVLFPNDRKEQENHPDVKGSIDVNGVEYWIAGWSKESKEGKQFISLRINPKDDSNGGKTTTKAKATRGKAAIPGFSN